MTVLFKDNKIIVKSGTVVKKLDAETMTEIGTYTIPQDISIDTMTATAITSTPATGTSLSSTEVLYTDLYTGTEPYYFLVGCFDYGSAGNIIQVAIQDNTTGLPEGVALAYGVKYDSTSSTGIALSSDAWGFTYPSISNITINGSNYLVEDTTARTTKQDLLVSGTNIKTINSTSLLGSGNVDVSPAIDNNTITKNASDQLQTNGILNQRTSTALKVWNGSLNNWTHSGESTNWYNWRGGFPYVNAAQTGTLTVTSDYVVSGFGTSKYLQIFQNPFDDANTWEIKLKFTTNSSPSTNQKIFHAIKSSTEKNGLGIYMSGSHFTMMASTNGSSWAFDTSGSYTVLANTTYYLKAKFDGTKYVLSYSLDDETYIDDITYTSSTKLYSPLPAFWLGIYRGDSIQNPFLGSIDLKECYVKANDNIVWEGVANVHTTNNVTVVGSPTITKDGLVTNFTYNSNAVALPEAFDYGQDFEFVVKAHVTLKSTYDVIIGVPSSTPSGVVIRASSGTRLYLWGTTDGSSWTTSKFDTGIDLALGVQYIKLTHANSQYIVSSSTDGTTWTTGNALSSADFTSCASRLGATVDGYDCYLRGSIDLKGCYIKVGDTITWQGATINEDYVLNTTPTVGDSLYSAPNVVATDINASIVGSPTISSDYVVSGFSTNDYLRTSTLTLQTGDTFVMKLKCPTSSYSSVYWSNGSYYLIWDSGYSIVRLYNSSGYVPGPNIYRSNEFIAKLEIGETTINFSVYNGSTWSTAVSLARDNDFSQTNYFGVKSDLSDDCRGTIYMSDCYVTRDGSTVWSGVAPLAVSSVASNVITATNGSTYNRNASGDLQIEKTVGEAHSDYLCFVDNKDVRLGTTTIAEIAPTKISDLEDDTTTTPIDKADTLTGLTATVSELNYSDGVTSNIQTQLDDKVEANTAITGATKTKITYDSKGLVTAGADLEESDIPSLHLAKITDVSATAAEVNVLDGISATTTELNYCDGVTSNIQTQLDAKASASEVVTLTGMQTISGIKVFTDNPILQSAQPTVKLYETDVEKGVTPSQTENSFLGIVYDKNGSSESNKLAQVFSEYKADGSLSLNMSCFNPVSGSTASDKIMIAYDSSNQSYTQCPTPTEDTTSSVQIDTVGARNTKLATKQDVRQTIADTTSTTATISNLQAGCDYTFSNALVSLTISAVTSSMYESCVYFTAGTGITVSLPSDIKMLGSTPSYSAGNSYVICFKNGFAVVGVYEA